MAVYLIRMTDLFEKGINHKLLGIFIVYTLCSYFWCISGVLTVFILLTVQDELLEFFFFLKNILWEHFQNTFKNYMLASHFASIDQGQEKVFNNKSGILMKKL